MTPTLLPKKLLAIRDFLTIGQAEMAESISSEILSQSGRSANIKPGTISDYENGRSEPNLFVLLAYAHLGKVHLELVADDRFTIQEFREQLGKRAC